MISALRRSASFLGAFAVPLLLAGALRAQEIWLAPQASVPPSPLNRAVDFIDMFGPDAPWREAASHVAVFKLYGSYLSPAPQGQVDAIVADLNRRRMAIGLEVGVMNIGPKSTNPPCGGLGLVEGYGTPAQAHAIAKKIKEAGGTLRFLAMDEPLWFGHYFKGRPNGQPGCRSSIDEIVTLAAETLAVYVEEFPGIVIGDIEPTDVAEQPNWQADLAAFCAGFRQVTGKPLAFLHLDIPWARPNEEAFAVTFFREAQALRQHGLIGKLGIIYNGAPTDKTDAQWVEDARRHVEIIEDRRRLRPDQAIIQSWNPNPTHAMPDTSPETLTGLVTFYARRPHVEVRN